MTPRVPPLESFESVEDARTDLPRLTWVALLLLVCSLLLAGVGVGIVLAVPS